MFTPTAPDGLFLDEENPELALNTYDTNLSVFLTNLNSKRLRTNMAVNILSDHNKSVVATGVVVEVIPPQAFSGHTGQFHESVVSVRLQGSRTIAHYAASRVIPASLLNRTHDAEQEIPTAFSTDRHHSTFCDD